MLKKIVLGLVVVCVILGGAYFAVPMITGPKEETGGTAGLMDDSAIVFPQLTFSYGKYKDVPASPFMLTAVTEDYSLGSDEVGDILVNYKSESAYLDPRGITRLGAQKDTEKFTIGNIESEGGLMTVELPEPPMFVSGNVYYSHSVGIKPTYTALEWTMPKANDPEVWKKAAETAGLETFTEANVIQRNEETGTEVCVSNYKNKDGSLVMEITWGRAYVKEEIGETVTSKKEVPKTAEGEEITPATLNVKFMVTTRADNAVRRMFANDLKSISEGITSNGTMEMLGFEWRKPVTIPSFRIAAKNSLFGMDFLTLSDKRLFGYEDAPLLSCYMEVWNNYIISWSAVLFESDWNKVRGGFLKEISGKDSLTAEELDEGFNTEKGVNVVVRSAGVFGNSNEKLVAVMISDRFADKLISSAFEKYSSVYVEGLRAAATEQYRALNKPKDEDKAQEKVPDKKEPVRVLPPKAPQTGEQD